MNLPFSTELNPAAPVALATDDAFGRSLAGTIPGLRQHLRGQLSAADAVDDVVQESCLRALRYRGSIAGEDLRAMLYRIAANVITDRHRRAESHRAHDHCALDEAELPPAGAGPEQVEMGRENLALIMDAIGHLPPRCREVFVLHRFEGLSYREIGQRLGTSPRTVENQVAHALAACMNVIGD